MKPCNLAPLACNTPIKCGKRGGTYRSPSRSYEDAALRLHHSPEDDVLRGGQLDLVLLAVELMAEKTVGSALTRCG